MPSKSKELEPQSFCQRIVVFYVSFCDVLLLLLAELLVRRCRFVNLTAVGVCLRLCRICQLRQRRELRFGIVDLLIEGQNLFCLL